MNISRESQDLPATRDGWFLTLKPKGISSEVLKYYRQGSVCLVCFFSPHFEFLAAARSGSTEVSRVSLLSLGLSCKLRKFEET